MRFLVDENLEEDVSITLAGVYLAHEFVSAYSDHDRYCGTDDLDLFPIVQEDGFDAIVTQDKNQMANDAERRALYDCGLHWVGHQSKDWPGQKGLALRIATVVAGLTFVLDDWRPEPHLYRLKGIEALVTQRVMIKEVWLDHWV